MHLQLGRLALLATALSFQPAHAEDELPRLCDFTRPEAQIDIESICPESGECYVGFYPPDLIPVLDAGYCWPNGTDPIVFRDPETGNSVSLVAVIFESVDPPSSALRCERTPSSCDIECEAYPIGDGITHAWSAYSGEGANPVVTSYGNEATVRLTGPKPVFIDAKVVSPFDLEHSSFTMENGDPACNAPLTPSPRFSAR